MRILHEDPRSHRRGADCFEFDHYPAISAWLARVAGLSDHVAMD